jgi:hypothetical protein
LKRQVTPAIETGQKQIYLSGFHNLAAKVLADRASRVTLQATYLLRKLVA